MFQQDTEMRSVKLSGTVYFFLDPRHRHIYIDDDDVRRMYSGKDFNGANAGKERA